MIIQIKVALQLEVHIHPGHLTRGDLLLVSLFFYKHPDILFEDCIHHIMKICETFIRVCLPCNQRHTMRRTHPLNIPKKTKVFSVFLISKTIGTLQSFYKKNLSDR